ncbi:MAG: hypothetical protein LBL31_02415 [Spirochaetaceae bacterium]|jgi:hypothetical protein|nr:hypothetical protein [Spirochaetaceae bacterium]
MPPRTLFFAGYLCLFLSPLFCANVSVLVVETGLQDGRPLFYHDTASLWETGLMDAFFEEGHVVTNAQAIALEKKPETELADEIQDYIMDARDTGMDYFVLAYLSYEAAQDGKFYGRPKPAGIELHLFNINLSKRVWTQYVDLGQAVYPKTKELGRVKHIARSLFIHLGDSI